MSNFLKRWFSESAGISGQPPADVAKQELGEDVGLYALCFQERQKGDGFYKLLNSPAAVVDVIQRNEAWRDIDSCEVYSLTKIPRLFSDVKQIAHLVINNEETRFGCVLAIDKNHALELLIPDEEQREKIASFLKHHEYYKDFKYRLGLTEQNESPETTYLSALASQLAKASIPLPARYLPNDTIHTLIDSDEVLAGKIAESLSSTVYGVFDISARIIPDLYDGVATPEVHGDAVFSEAKQFVKSDFVDAYGKKMNLEKVNAPVTETEWVLSP